MAVIIEQIYATAKAKKHIINKHNVEWYEVEEAMARSDLRPIRDKKVNGEMRYQVRSHTEAGRKLRIIFTIQRRRARIITAIGDN